MKKFLAIILTFTLLLSGCISGGQNDNVPEPTVAPSATVTVHEPTTHDPNTWSSRTIPAEFAGAAPSEIQDRHSVSYIGFPFELTTFFGMIYLPVELREDPNYVYIVHLVDEEERYEDMYGNELDIWTLDTDSILFDFSYMDKYMNFHDFGYLPSEIALAYGLPIGTVFEIIYTMNDFAYIVGVWLPDENHVWEFYEMFVYRETVEGPMFDGNPDFSLWAVRPYLFDWDDDDYDHRSDYDGGGDFYVRFDSAFGASEYSEYYFVQSFDGRTAVITTVLPKMKVFFGYLDADGTLLFVPCEEVEYTHTTQGEIHIHAFATDSKLADEFILYLLAEIYMAYDGYEMWDLEYIYDLVQMSLHGLFDSFEGFLHELFGSNAEFCEDGVYIRVKSAGIPPQQWAEFTEIGVYKDTSHTWGRVTATPRRDKLTLTYGHWHYVTPIAVAFYADMDCTILIENVEIPMRAGNVSAGIQFSIDFEMPWYTLYPNIFFSFDGAVWRIR
jgi:hypothetical protein